MILSVMLCLVSPFIMLIVVVYSMTRLGESLPFGYFLLVPLASFTETAVSKHGLQYFFNIQKQFGIVILDLQFEFSHFWLQF